MRNIAFTLTMLVGLIGSAQAVEGDAEAGKTKSAPCAACHGADGNAAITIYPKIAGQHAGYIYKQLTELKLGMTSGGKEGRYDPVMSAMASPLSDQDMKDLAAYFSSQTMTSGSTAEDVVVTGQDLYRGGDMERGIPACLACHGPRGVGHSLAGFPKISFQNPDYIKSQLEKFRAGTRNNDMNGMMRDIAVKLTDKDIEILSKYMSGLH
ncbi:cytochrome c [Psychrosphaera saromensis]|uniref:Cytochrome c4 n=1 Tax=Psychrosphaera saromensis TaxID=716813 RepID=A0A2S7UST3_9GAMM|nr:c-type cytochrome [Psychrosphaera saromensis]PQJ53003.1 cytochrome c4 [Psychrosphaera saromensis]GHB77312.1 cytochrome c [Psychrosphaera saromensis]GLQ12833.1 cytochrome c [Psychrosphaera saromensis]